jgi:hypothetical protein
MCMYPCRDIAGLFHSCFKAVSSILMGGKHPNRPQVHPRLICGRIDRRNTPVSPRPSRKDRVLRGRTTVQA